MSIRRALIHAVALISLLLTAPLADADIARPAHERRLSNGLHVIISPDPAGADVSVLVDYDAGARDEPAGLEGLAHLVEHIMFQGSKHVAPGELSRLLEQAGATNINGTTTVDTTTYFETMPPERLELALWLESDRMGYGLDRLDEATLSRAKAEVLNEQRDRVIKHPLGQVPEIESAELFPSWHPYHHLPAGTPASIARISLADARAFANTWYGPANAVLVITGKVDPKAAAALVEKYFGSLPSRTPPSRPALPPVITNETTIVHVGANVTREELHFTWVTPRYGASGDAELDLAAAILVNRGAGWLEHLLLRPPQLCNHVYARQRSMKLASVFEIGAVIAPGRPTKQVFEQIIASLGRFETGVTDDEIKRAQIVFQNRTLFELEASLAQARRLTFSTQLGPLPATFDGQSGRYAALTPAAVRHAVRTWLGTSPWVITVSHPRRDKSLSGQVIEKQAVAW